MSRRFLSIGSGNHSGAEFRDTIRSHNEQPRSGSLSVNETRKRNSHGGVEKKGRGTRVVNS